MADEGTEKRARLLITDDILWPDGAIWVDVDVRAPGRAGEVATWGIAAYLNNSGRMDFSSVSFSSAYSLRSAGSSAFHNASALLGPARLQLGTGFQSGESLELAFTARKTDAPPGDASPDASRPFPVEFLWRILPPIPAAQAPIDVASPNWTGQAHLIRLTDEREYASKIGFTVAAGVTVASGALAVDAGTQNMGLATTDLSQSTTPVERIYSASEQPHFWNAVVGMAGGASSAVTYSLSTFAGGQKTITNARTLPAGADSEGTWMVPVVVVAFGKQASDTTLK